MTRDEAITEYTELELTYPIKPYTPAEEIRADEAAERILALFDYIYKDGPVPTPGWRPSVPSPTGKDRERHILYWAATSRRESLGMGADDETDV